MLSFGFILSLFLWNSGDPSKTTTEQYIELYKGAAIEEMHRSGIPASITLAQGYLESGCGNSTLATKARNHFGIKCHKDWTGKTYYIEYDDLDENGKLKKSCFRVYSSPNESFKDHSAFLTGRTRYAFLFDLRTTDYKGWARGLKKAGYATNPKYADLLINIIERYNLDQYDGTKEKKLFAHARLQEKEVFEINNIPAIAYDGQMSIREIRDKYYIAEWQIYKYNDLDRKTALKPGMILYLKPKRTAKDAAKTHSVAEGETMQYIAQLRGVKLKKLYRYNLMSKGEEPMKGEILQLKSKASQKPEVEVKNRPYKYFSTQNEEQFFEVISTPKTSTAPDGPKAERSLIERPDGLYHQVKQGESLLSIARAYDMNWNTLKDQNKLEKESLEIGQMLLIKPKKEIEDNQIKQEGEGEENIVPLHSEEAETDKTIGNPSFHLVKKGETLFSISRLYGMTVADLIELNKLEEPRISEGENIRVQ